MTRNLEISINEFYHVYNRGTDKRKVFITRYDYERFVALLYLANSNEPVRIDTRKKSLNDLFDSPRKETLVDIGAFCLMPNHFHLLLHEKTENGISNFMHKLTTAYTMYFNKKNERNGALFQGVFKAEHLDNDNYLKYIFAYINLNPIKLQDPNWKEFGIKNLQNSKTYLEKYEYCSYPEHTNKNRKQRSIINNKAFPKYFEKAKDFEQMIEFWLSSKHEFK